MVTRGRVGVPGAKGSAAQPNNPPVPMKSDNPSRVHHYLPEFYQRRWAKLKGGPVWRYQRLPNGKLDEKEVSTKSTGYVRDLYKHQHAVSFFTEEPSDVIEKKFFGKIDNDGALALDALINSRPLEAGARRAWAIFLLSMLHRDPKSLAERDAVAPALVRDTLERLRAKNLLPDSAVRLEGTLKDIDLVAMGLNTVREAMMREIEDPAHVAYFEACEWRVFPVADEYPPRHDRHAPIAELWQI